MFSRRYAYMMRRALCVLMIFCIVLTAYIPAINAKDNTEAPMRYTVLILDTSGSMSGTPLKVQKQAAVKFCESILETRNKSYVALVELNSSSSLLCNFTDSLSVLNGYIDSIYASGGTNITQALQVADSLLSGIDNSGKVVTKNVILCSDGLPQSGERTTNGPFTITDGSEYQYANASYNTAKMMQEKYNIYSLGFFHSLSGDELKFGQTLMEKIQNKGYYSVTSADDLVFVFEDLAWEMTQARIRELYVDQHVGYFNGRFRNEVTQIVLPNESTRENTNYILGNIVQDAMDSGSFKTYSFMNTFSQCLSLHFIDLINSSTTNYELLLADIVSSKYFSDIIEEATFASIVTDSVDGLGLVFDYIGDNIDSLARSAGETAETLHTQMHELGNALEGMSVLDDPQTFADLYGKASIIANKYVSAKKMKELITTAGNVFEKFEWLLSDEIFATATEVINYISCYDAYTTATDTLKETLTAMYVVVDQNLISGGLDAAYYKASLCVAILNFLENCAPNQTEMKNIIKRFAKSYIDNLTMSAIRNFVKACITSIPIIGAFYQAFSMYSTVGLLTVNMKTNIDDIAYKAAMIQHLYYFANCAAETANLLGAEIRSSKDSFAMARRFDMAVRLWRSSSIALAEFGYAFEIQRLQETQGQIRKLPEPLSTVANHILIKNMSWYSTAASMASAEKARISAIHCHNVNLSYDGTNNTVNIRNSALIIVIACPVTVSVKDAGGNVKAVLSDTVSDVASGYAPYFHVVETEPGSGDYMKICCIPRDWQIEFTGTGTGEMFISSAEISSGIVQNQKVSNLIEVVDGTQGHLNFEQSEDMIVIDTQPTSELSITLDQNAYVCNVGEEFVVGIRIATPDKYEEGNHKYIGYFAYFDRSQFAWDQVHAWYIDGGTEIGQLRMGIQAWKNLGENLFTVSVFPADNFAVGGSLLDYFFIVYILDKNEAVLTLPTTMKSIEAEAFSASPAQQVILPDSIESIDSAAFSHMYNLRQINIPATVQFIASDVFFDSPNVRIICPPDSYAASWASQNRVSAIVAGKLPTTNLKTRSTVNENESLIYIDIEQLMAPVNLEMEKISIELLEELLNVQ